MGKPKGQAREKTLLILSVKFGELLCVSATLRLSPLFSRRRKGFVKKK